MDVYYLLAGLAVRFPWLGALFTSGSPFNALLPAATPTPTTGGVDAKDAGNIRTFFLNLNGDLDIFVLAATGFFFGLSAIFYAASGITGNERMRQHSIGSLYAALGGLILVLLDGSIVALVHSAAGGQ